MKYLDICRQVHDGRLKQYTEAEIMSGLRKVVISGSVKTYIDSFCQTLTEVLAFLRSYLKEQTPSELSTKLSQMCQQEGQEAIKFFMEALETRQLIVVGSQAEGQVVQDSRIVYSTFLHTLRTGLRDESVRAHMLPFLSESNPLDDNALIRELQERKGKLQQQEMRSRKTVAKVNMVQTSPELVEIETCG